MLKIDSSKLIQQLSAPTAKQNIYFILADNPIFQKIVETKYSVKTFSGKNSIEDYVNYLSTCGMFAPAQVGIVELPEKLTQKNWTEAKKIMARIPLPVEVSAYFFGPTSLKNTIKETDVPKDCVYYLCYSPNDIDLPKCAHSLLLRYPSLAKKSAQEQAELARLTLESYSNELLSCEMHFARMEKGNLPFAAALAGNPEVNGFHVAEAIALRDKHLIELRMGQCANCGEEASAVFMALVYFLKQVAFVLTALAETKNLKQAFEQTKIPFPAQARLQKAVSFLTLERLHTFFVEAAKVEMEMRLQKNPHQYLAAELIRWLG